MDSWYKIYIPFIFLISSAGISWAGIYFLLHSPIVNFFKDRPEPRKLHIQPIPRLGGIAIITTFLLFIAGISIFNKPSNLFSDISTATLTIFIASSIVILIFGFLDDTSFVTIRVRHKIFAEVAIAFSAVYIFHLNIGTLSIFNSFSLPPSVSNIVSFLWIIGIINAYNLIDGLDGLAGSISLIGIAFLAVLAGIGEQSSIILICCILSGTVIGFLIHNTEPAKTFMGDTGSLFLGTVIALLTLYIGRDVTPQRAFIVMPLIAGLPIIEVFITMVRRYFKSKDRKDKHAERIHSMVIPDNSHIHHRFIYRGYSPFQSTIILSLLSFILGCGAICCALAPSIFIPFILVYLSIPIIIALYRLGFGGRFKKALRISETRYNGYKKSSFIGVIDRDGSISQLLEKQKSPIVDYNFVPINEDQVPAYLHTAIVYDTFTPESKLEEKAEKISTLLSRPVFIIKKNGSSNYFNIQQISRNGSLSVLRKTVSIRELARDLEKVSRSDKIKHPPSTPTPTVLFPPEPFSSQENEYEPELAYAES